MHIGVDYNVVLSINPDIALENFRTPPELLNHIENRVICHMSSLIRNANSASFQPLPVDASVENKEFHDGQHELQQDHSLSSFVADLQKKATEALIEDLQGMGITVTQVTIKRWTPLNKQVAQELEKVSITTAQARGRLTQAHIEYQTAKLQAKQSKRVVMLAAEAQAEATKTKAAAEAEAAKQRAEGYKSEQNARIEMMQKEAQLLQQNPAYYQLRLIEIQAKAMSGVRSTVISPDVAKGLYAQFGLFSMPPADQQRPSLLATPAEPVIEAASSPALVAVCT